MTLESMIRWLVQKFDYDLVCTRQRQVPAEKVPDLEMYQPVFSPWLGYGEFASLMKDSEPYTLVTPNRCWVLYVLARQQCKQNGCIAECGVYRAGTARLIAETASREITTPPPLHLFDTFEGMPETDATRDLHVKGDFADTSLGAVQQIMRAYDFAEFHVGYIPATFDELDNDAMFSLVHIDLDIYRSILDSCAYFYPRMKKGSVIVFDDYGFITCPGARKAVDEFFADKPEVLLSLPTGQAIVIHA